MIPLETVGPGAHRELYSLSPGPGVGPGAAPRLAWKQN